MTLKFNASLFFPENFPVISSQMECSNFMEMFPSVPQGLPSCFIFQLFNVLYYSITGCGNCAYIPFPKNNGYISWHRVSTK